MEKAAKIEWKYHPLREFLRLELINGLLELDNKTGPEDVWNKYCDVRPDLFAGMSCDQTFASRLRGLRSQLNRDLNRAEDDADAFFIHRKNYPYHCYNVLGEPNWYGSEAEKLLEQDIAAGRYPTLTPMALYADIDRPEYREFSLDVFRGHIHQILETKKYKHTLKTRDAEKKAKREEERQKKIQSAAEKEENAARRKEEAARKIEEAAKKKEEAAKKKEEAAKKKEEAAKAAAEKKEAAAKKKEAAAKAAAEKKEVAARKKEEAAKKKEAAAKAAAEKKEVTARKKEEAAKKKAEKEEAAARKKEAAAEKKEAAAKKKEEAAAKKTAAKAAKK
jgi:hypothetical protein